jgi:hypothetical protein
MFELITGGGYLFDLTSGPWYSKDDDRMAQIVEPNDLEYRVSGSELFDCKVSRSLYRFLLYNTTLHPGDYVVVSEGEGREDCPHSPHPALRLFVVCGEAARGKCAFAGESGRCLYIRHHH